MSNNLCSTRTQVNYCEAANWSTALYNWLKFRHGDQGVQRFHIYRSTINGEQKPRRRGSVSSRREQKKKPLWILLKQLNVRYCNFGGLITRQIPFQTRLISFWRSAVCAPHLASGSTWLGSNALVLHGVPARGPRMYRRTHLCQIQSKVCVQFYGRSHRLLGIVLVLLTQWIMRVRRFAVFSEYALLSR